MKYIITIWLLIISVVGYSQCGNTDFELGDFTGWNARLGTCCPITLPTVGFTGTRQVIMTQGIDPHSCGGLRTVYQGVYSARLGNDRVGAQAEGLSYTLTITPSSTIIRYAYAVVFQDPNHTQAEQPRFQARVRLANGTVIPCTDYTVTAASGLPGFQYCAQPNDTTLVAWRDWTEMAVDLSAYVGQTVTLEFETGDCQRRGHYGYAYIDAVQCGQSINHVTYCENDTTLSIDGMGGFANYQWQTGDTTQGVTINPQLYDTITCVVTTFQGCQLTLYYVLNMAPGHPNFTPSPSCSGLVQIINTSNASYSPINYLWTFPNGTTSTLQNPTITLSPGTYDITLYISSNLGCGRDTTITVVIDPTPSPDFTATVVCLGNPTTFTNTTPSIPGYNILYSWNLGDNTVSTNTNLTHIYQSAGTYNVTLTATTAGTPCNATVNAQVIVNPNTSVPSPIIYN
jgi:hypothetical protein